VLFGLAAWFTCGLASQVVIFGGRLPNLSLFGSAAYSIMADLVLGWGFLLFSHVLARRAAGSGEAEHAASIG
jgi:hypothetical protein